MDYIFKQESSLAHYSAEAYVLRCFDDRFWKTFKNFLKNRGIRRLDPASASGGAKVLANPEKENDRDFILREIENSVRLHHTPKVMLFTHADCGALGGRARFAAAGPAAEFAFHRDLHERARAVLRARFPILHLESYFLDEHGVRAL